MMKRWFFALIVAFGLGGCVGLTQFPAVTNSDGAALRGLDADYATTLDRIYGSDPVHQTGVETASSSRKTTPAFVPPDTEEQKRIRNAMIERRIAVIDAYFKEFQASLVKEDVRSEFGMGILGIGVGGAGSLVPETTSRILSAVSGGMAGAQAVYGKAVLYDKAMSALLAQMQAGRKAVAAQIFQHWNLGIDQYPIWMARMDLDAYYFAGSLPGAIMGTAADARVKEAQADEQIKLVRSADFTGNLEQAKAIGVRLKNLTLDQALTLAKVMEPFIQKRSPKLIDLMNQLDPSKERLRDGRKAKEILFKWQIFDDRDPSLIKQWTDALTIAEQT